MIQLSEVRIGYAGQTAIRVPEAVFETGRISSILGRNGSGKSTLLKGITGILPYQGSIRIGERESRAYGSHERARQVAYLPQLLKNTGIDVETLVEHGRYPHHGNLRRMTAHDKELCEYAMEATGLADYRGRLLTELSGGERQRAYLAMVIAQDTPMILLDEPVTYMDISHQLRFHEILRRLAGEGRGIVMASHDLVQSFTYSDRIYLVAEGQLTAGGTPEELCAEEELLERVLGVAVKRIGDEELLYPYALRGKKGVSN